MPEFSTRFARTGGYSFSDTSIISLANEVEQFTAGDVEMTITLRGDHEVASRKGDNLVGILRDSFVTNNVITKIAITGSVYRPNTCRIGVVLGGWDAVDVSISGDRDKCMSTRAEVETITQHNGSKILPDMNLNFLPRSSTPSPRGR
jgi:hypothetical protein